VLDGEPPDGVGRCRTEGIDGRQASSVSSLEVLRPPAPIVDVDHTADADAAELGVYDVRAVARARKQVMTLQACCVDSQAMRTNWGERARRLQSEALTVYLVARHPCTPWYAKLLAACVAAYALSPIDLIPDPIPVLGFLDDLLIVPLGLALVLKLIPEEVLAECRAKAQATAQAPTSWAGAVIVLSVWLVLAVLAVAFIRRLIRG